MKIARLPFQIITLCLHVWFIVKAVQMFTFKDGEDAWFAMLAGLLIVIACEIVAFFDILLFVISKHDVYSFINLALYVTNAVFFMKVTFYSNVGTVIGLSLYAVIFILRVINLVWNWIEIRKTSLI